MWWHTPAVSDNLEAEERGFLEPRRPARIRERDSVSKKYQEDCWSG
jgi:hypothetical protein